MPDTPFPESTERIWGRDDVRGKSKKGIPNAKFNDGSSDVKVESLMPQDLYLGQIVPFEIEITVVGLEYPEDGNMQFTAGWRTDTTNGDAFGYDGTIGVLAAFVDTRDGATWDPQGDAAVSAFSWSIVDGNEIQGVFDVTGFDDGDVVVVEIWMVLQKTSVPDAGGNVHSRLIDARTGTTNDAINTGEQTVPLQKSAAKSGTYSIPSDEERVGYEDWLANYDPSYRPIDFLEEVDEENIHFFCG
jgi:hypothetical protein